MRAFLAACLTIAVIAIGASLVLKNLNKPVDVPSEPPACGCNEPTAIPRRLGAGGHSVSPAQKTAVTLTSSESRTMAKSVRSPDRIS